MVLVVPELRRLKPFAMWSVGALAALKLGLHYWVNTTTAYGLHRDGRTKWAPTSSPSL